MIMFTIEVISGVDFIGKNIIKKKVNQFKKVDKNLNQIIIKEEIRISIKAYIEDKKLVSEIKKLLRQTYGDETPHFSTIYRIVTNYQINKNITPKLMGIVGRKSIYSKKQQDQIVEHFQKNPLTSLRQGQRNKDINPQAASFKTIDNILNQNNLTAFKRPSVLYLTQSQKQERFNFAKKHQRWNQKWKQIIFSDESYIYASKIVNQFKWATSREDIKSEDCFQKQQYPLKIHVFGVIGYEGPFFIKSSTSSLNSEEQIKNLEECLMKFRFKQVSGFFNRTRRVVTPQKRLQTGQSNRISAIKRQVEKRKYEFENSDQLWKLIENIFFQHRTIKTTIFNYYNSLPFKISQVVLKQGEIIQ